MEHMTYRRLTQGVDDFGILIKSNEPYKKYIKNWEKDHYISINSYSEIQFKEFQKTKSVAGVKDVSSNLLAFDFDCKEDLNKAREDAIELLARLSEKLDIELEEEFNIFFSGMKGFTITLNIDKFLPPFKIAHLALNVLGKNLKTLDPSLYNATRILRIPGTKHPESGLYKIPLSYDELKNSDIEDIKEMALEPREEATPSQIVKIPDKLVDIKEVVVEKKQYTEGLVNYSAKPKNWTNCKWNILQGELKPGQRHMLLTALTATCKGLGFTKDITFDMCNGALIRSIDKYGQGSTDEKDLRENIIETVFGDTWAGGQFTCKVPGPLQTYCDTLGEHKCNLELTGEKPFVKFDEMFDDLVKFSKDFEKNILKTGIKTLDDNCILSVSTLNGLLGQPGAGKTTMAMDYLKYTSKNNIPSAFFSLDMGKPIVTAKIIQQRIGMNFLKALEYVKEQTEAASILAKTIIKEDYENVNFNFKSGLSVENMRSMIQQQEEISGKKIKLVVIDYLECLVGPYSDSNANVGLLSKQLKDMANELEVCILLLLQTQKHATADISDPLLTMRNVKGASAIEQDCTTILTLWRDGYSPKYKDDDRYISFAVVKTRFGGQWMGDFSWNPINGKIKELTEEQARELEIFRKKKIQDKNDQLKAGNSGWE